MIHSVVSLLSEWLPSLGVVAFVALYIWLISKAGDSSFAPLDSEPSDFQMSQSLTRAREDAERLGYSDLADALQRVSTLWAMGATSACVEILDDLLADRFPSARVRAGKATINETRELCGFPSLHQDDFLDDSGLSRQETSLQPMWKGRALTDMSKEELLQALSQLGEMYHKELHRFEVVP